MFSFFKKRLFKDNSPSNEAATVPTVHSPADTPTDSNIIAQEEISLVTENPIQPPITPVAESRTIPSTPNIIEPEVTPPKRSWHQRLRAGLARTSQNLATLFTGTRIDDALFEELESALICADVGVTATHNLLEELRKQVKQQQATTPAAVKQLLRQQLHALLQPLEHTLELGRVQPLVIMMVGVNGAGKTTSIGKLCQHLQSYQQSVLLAAGDTFRAAAREQLSRWGERNGVTVIAQESADPAAVVFDAIGAGSARGHDVVIIDTAGRLPTQLHLMAELKKIQKVATKAMPDAPHERWLVIDATNGQNALNQVKAFDDALGLTGLIVTKLDGTARGGILAAIATQRPVPVYFIGVGEQLDDLQPFDAQTFTDALLGDLAD